MPNCLLLVKVVDSECVHEQVRCVLYLVVKSRKENGKEQKILGLFLRFQFPFMMKRRRRRNTKRIRRKKKRGSISTDMKRRRLKSMIKKRNTKRKRRSMSFRVFVNKGAIRSFGAQKPNSIPKPQCSTPVQSVENSFANVML